jgi:hypothetical protein
MSLDDVKSHLLYVTALMDQQIEIDGMLGPDAALGQRRSASQRVFPTTAEIYRQRNNAGGVQ